jgi:hypothetical protein
LIFLRRKKKVRVCGIIGISWEIILTIHFIVPRQKLAVKKVDKSSLFIKKCILL